MDSFMKRHPLVTAGYYITAFLMLLMAGHPTLYIVAVICLLVCRFFQIGGRQCLRSLLYCIGAAALCLVINPLFNHRGVTVLFELGDTRITKEAVLYGGHMVLLLIASVNLFSCFSYYMTSEKIMALMGKRLPAFSMLFSMILRMVPKVKRDFKEITRLQGNRPKVWSALFGMGMEESVERSIAMKQKQYGERNRSHYWGMEMAWQDWTMVGLVCCMLGYLIRMKIFGLISVRYFPSIYITHLSWQQWLLYIVYFGMPVWLRGKEECKWFLWRQKITNSITRNRQNRRFLSGNGRSKREQSIS